MIFHNSKVDLRIEAYPGDLYSYLFTIPLKPEFLLVHGCRCQECGIKTCFVPVRITILIIADIRDGFHLMVCAVCFATADASSGLSVNCRTECLCFITSIISMPFPSFRSQMSVVSFRLHPFFPSAPAQVFLISPSLVPMPEPSFVQSGKMVFKKKAIKFLKQRLIQQVLSISHNCDIHRNGILEMKHHQFVPGLVVIDAL